MCNWPDCPDEREGHHHYRIVVWEDNTFLGGLTDEFEVTRNLEFAAEYPEEQAKEIASHLSGGLFERAVAQHAGTRRPQGLDPVHHK